MGLITTDKVALLPPRKKMRIDDNSAIADPQPSETLAMGLITTDKVYTWASAIVRLSTTAGRHIACESKAAMLLTRLLRIVEHLARAAPEHDTGGLRVLSNLGVLDSLSGVLVNSKCTWPPGWRVSPEQLPLLIAARPAFQRFRAVYPSSCASESPPPHRSGLGTVRYGHRVAEINPDGEGVTDPRGGNFDGVMAWMVTMGPHTTSNENAASAGKQSSIVLDTSHTTPPSPVPSSKSLQYGEFDFFSLTCVLHACGSKLMRESAPGRRFTMVGSLSGQDVLPLPRLASILVGSYTLQ